MNKPRLPRLLAQIRRRVFPGLALLLLAMLAAGLLLPTRQASAPPRANLAALPLAGSGFSRAAEPRAFTFPSDHGPHNDFQTEWWYYTGSLRTADGRAFGYQLTFFRRALLGPGQALPRLSAWAADQVYMAHLALSDVSGGHFQSYERFSRAAAGLAGAQGQPLFQVWLEDWSVTQLDANQYRLRARQAGLELDLNLKDTKGPVLQGDRGLSQKGPEPGSASYYISLTHLETTGSLALGGQAFPVSGLSWMDHEFSTSALGADYVGWDWFALQLSDGSELMLFTLRSAAGKPAVPFASGTLVAADGTARTITGADFQITATAEWRSPASGARYPAAWQIRIPSADLQMSVQPLLPDQENRLSFTYWEGAVQIRGSRGGQALTGAGYVELTGYAQSMHGQF